MVVGLERVALGVVEKRGRRWGGLGLGHSANTLPTAKSFGSGHVGLRRKWQARYSPLQHALVTCRTRVQQCALFRQQSASDKKRKTIAAMLEKLCRGTRIQMTSR